MDFRFSEAEDAWRKEVQEFCANEIPEGFVERLIQEQGCTNPHSQELYLKMAERGWLGLHWPKQYGGQERSYIEQAIFIEEIVRGGCPAGTVNVISNTTQYLAGSLLRYGTEEQKGRWLPLIAKGQLRSCQGLSEPNAGNDLASVQLRALEESDHYVLNGTKIFNNAHNATHMFTVTRTDPTVPKHRGISLFLVDLSSSGISISPLFTAGGDRRNEVSFQDVRVPKENMLGGKNRGWYDLVASLDFERSQGYRYANLMTTFLDVVSCVKEMTLEGKPLSQHPAVRYALADIATELQVVWLLSYHVVWLQARGENVTARESPIAKLMASEVEEHFANVAMDILGLYGQLERWGGERRRVPLGGRLIRLFMDGRKPQIAGGSSEIQLNIIALRGLGLPRG